MDMMRKIICAGLILAAADLFAAYEAPKSFNKPKHVETLRATGEANDTALFQEAIDTISSRGGGHVVVSVGTYTLMDVELKSDVHLIFESGVALLPVKGRDGNLFHLGRDELTENVSLIGSDDRTLVDLTGIPETTKIRVFVVGDCDNFRIANFTVNDNHSVFSSLTLGWGGVRGDGKAMIARNALIENLTANNAHYGYGSIQAHSGENITFRNIKSIGGVAVRLETGYKRMNLSGVGGLHNVLVENVESVNGQAAVFCEPHTMIHGDVVLRDLRSDGSEFALYIANGFVSKKKYGEGSGKTVGHFNSITVDGVTAVYRDGPTVTRYPHLKYYPKELHGQIVRTDNGGQPGYLGPSIAAVANMRVDEPNNITIKNVEAVGFEYHPDIITPVHWYKGSIKHLTEQPIN